MPRDYSFILEPMLEEAKTIAEALVGISHDEYMAALHLRRSVHLGFILIGELAGKLSAEFRALHPGIDWRRIISMRNRLVHDYESLDEDIVWLSAQRSLPQLIAQLTQMLQDATAG